jgi:hypothetical protein
MGKNMNKQMGKKMYALVSYSYYITLPHTYQMDSTIVYFLTLPETRRP